MSVSQQRQPLNGRRPVTATATPIAQVTVTSGSPTFTTKRVTDSGAWDLSEVENGMIVEVNDAVTGERYLGVINSVVDGSQYVEVQGWIKGGVSGRRNATMKPTDGQTAIIHKIDRCKELLIDALDSNTADTFIGFASDVTIGSGAKPGHPVSSVAAQPNARLPLSAGLDKYIDLTKTYVIGTIGNELSWIAM